MKKIQRSIIFVIGILLWVMQGQSVFAAGSTELLSGTIANTTISYRLTEDGTLTIYSDNIEEMPNYTVNSTVPWAAQKDKIKKVQINSYLKNIGDYAFYGCDSLESVVIQDSKLTEIGIAAFKNCKNLKTINIPETVKAIGTMGFAKYKEESGSYLKGQYRDHGLCICRMQIHAVYQDSGERGDDRELCFF